MRAQFLGVALVLGTAVAWGQGAPDDYCVWKKGELYCYPAFMRDHKSKASLNLYDNLSRYLKGQGYSTLHSRRSLLSECFGRPAHNSGRSIRHCVRSQVAYKRRTGK